jgi:type I restriction enzyme R subunit
VKLAIEEALDTGLPRSYTPEVYKGKCSKLFEHVYENYYGENTGTYSGTA